MLIKIRLSILLLIFVFISTKTSAQIRCDAKLFYKSNSYTICTLPIDSNTIKNLVLVQNAADLNHSDFIDEYNDNRDSVLFATNACISNSNGQPIGLFISNAKQINPINLNDGNGNFYLKPNGILLVTSSDVIITESSQVNKYTNIIEGIQSGPMLLDGGKIHPVFDSSSQNKNIRSAVGIYANGANRFLVFVKSNVPVTFYDFALLFKERFNCQDALCLEGVGCALYSTSIGIVPPIGNNPIGTYLIYRKNTGRPKQKIIQMTKSTGGTYNIPVELNRVLKINFIFDSGASDVSISPDIAMTLIKTGTIDDADFIGTQKYIFANGSSANSKVFILHEINIGGYILKNVRASISNSIDAPMLLGQSVLQRIGQFTIDNNKHTLTIE